jgi:cell division protein FtsZ
VQSEQGIDGLRNEVDTLIVIPNDRLLSISDRQVSVLDAFRSADQVLLSGVQGITDLITTPGLINLDFADVKSVMSNAGSALMGIGNARGDDRAAVAAEMAISSPLLEASVDGAHGVLLSISGGSDLGLFEINEAASLVADAAHPEANIIFGAVIDDALGDEVRVTVIAAGFDGGGPQPRREARRQVAAPPQAAPRPQAGSSPARPAPAPAPAVPAAQPRPRPDRPERPERTERPEPGERRPQPSRRPAPTVPPRRPVVFEDDLDVPDFLK